MVRKKGKVNDDGTADGDNDTCIVTMKCLLNSLLRDDNHEKFVKVWKQRV